MTPQALLMDFLFPQAKPLTLEETYERVVSLLLRCCVEIDGKHVTEPLTHDDIGRRVGAPRDRVARVLYDLARGGYLDADQGRITILRRPPSRW